MILHRHDSSAGRARARDERGGVDGLHRVGVDDADADALAGERVVGGERLEHRHAGRDHRHRVGRRLPEHLAPADRERLGGVVDDGRLGPARAHVGRPLAFGHRDDEPLGAHAVARIEHRAVGHGAHHGEVLERHLGRTVLADRHAGVRSGELDAEA